MERLAPLDKRSEIERCHSLRAMELRKHSKMRWQTRPNWPLQWTGPHGPDNPLPQGEVGVLARVTGNRELKPPHCVLVMHHNEQDYFGGLFFDDEQFLHSICIILNAHIGESIAEIGSLDIPCRLPFLPSCSKKRTQSPASHSLRRRTGYRRARHVRIFYHFGIHLRPTIDTRVGLDRGLSLAFALTLERAEMKNLEAFKDTGFVWELNCGLVMMFLVAIICFFS
jgi:hypothetical protein